MYTITAYRVHVRRGPDEAETGVRYLLEPPLLDPTEYEFEVEAISVAVNDGIEVSQKRGGRKHLHRKACAYGVSLKVALERGWCQVLTGEKAGNNPALLKSGAS
jgi:hypothetical protein